jgi:hypothetical protein
MLRRRPLTVTERLQRLDRRAGAAAMLEAAHDPSVDVARRALVWTCDPMLEELGSAAHLVGGDHG